jgi:hypothetical protein
VFWIFFVFGFGSRLFWVSCFEFRIFGARISKLGFESML